MSDQHNKSIIYIRRWLCLSAFMVFAMAIIGAITRLTESGLSMVEWRPLIGALPPLNETEWARVFNLYQISPQYQQINADMTLSEFKNIFFWEWFHRLWGRMIGLVFALPLAFFWIKGMIPSTYKKPFITLLILGGMQGVMGWVMVMSGLVDNPAVSHFRLAAHLLLAFIIFGWLMWYVYRLTPNLNTKSIPSFCLSRHGWSAVIFLAITVTWGAFTAGKDAGLIYNHWPHMGQGHFIPTDMWFLDTIWQNLTENAAAIQFVHRWIAVLTLIMIGSFAWRVKSFPLGGMAMLQVGLGIATLLSQVHIHTAATHQAGSFILLALLLREMYKVRKII